MGNEFLLKPVLYRHGKLHNLGNLGTPFSKYLVSAAKLKRERYGFCDLEATYSKDAICNGSGLIGERFGI